jgi:hypothetical protein
MIERMIRSKILCAFLMIVGTAMAQTPSNDAAK